MYRWQIRNSPSLIIKEMQTKITVKYHYVASIKMAKIKINCQYQMLKM